MWISRRLMAGEPIKAPEEAKVTLQGTGAEMSGSYQTRNFIQYAPFGYQTSLPAGSDVLTVPAPSGMAAVGVASQTHTLAPGEIRIAASSGAYLLLRADGSAVINGLTITASGAILPP